MRALLFAALVVLFALHQDVWFWHDGQRLLGLPIGLTYHVLYCLAVSVLMALVVRWAWPDGLDDEAEANAP